jgi:hypothetical protein
VWTCTFLLEYQCLKREHHKWAACRRANNDVMCRLRLRCGSIPACEAVKEAQCSQASCGSRTRPFHGGD